MVLIISGLVLRSQLSLPKDCLRRVSLHAFSVQVHIRQFCCRFHTRRRVVRRALQQFQRPLLVDLHIDPVQICQSDEESVP